MNAIQTFGPILRGAANCLCGLSLCIPPARGAIRLSINGSVRQAGDLEDMIWSVGEIIASLSTYIEVAPGDLIFTGTPSGVGPIQRGETLRGTIAGVEPPLPSSARRVTVTFSSSSPSRYGSSYS